MFGLNTRLRSFQEELFEAFVPEFLDHIASVTWNDSGNKQPHNWEAQTITSPLLQCVLESPHY